MKARVRVVGAVTFLVLAWGCTTMSAERLGVEIEEPPAPPFAGEDGGADAAPELVAYCPTSECPQGWTTCPNSRFPCDVNLRADLDNCGACGASCARQASREAFACVDGACAIVCSPAPFTTLNCDGLNDNGCETDPIDNSHCGRCNNVCTDPENPCIERTESVVGYGDIGCGCYPNQILCGFFGCVDPSSDDRNCGGCRIRCDRRGDGGVLPEHAYYGCGAGQCGVLKCEKDYANCDDVQENGCEVFLKTNENCRACGNACPDGQACRLNQLNQPECMCAAGLTFCSDSCDANGLCKGSCVDLASDTSNCGACGASCRAVFPHATGACNYAMCRTHCHQGYADCNDTQVDGCETNTNSDPRNCGGCGNVCDAVAGQACVAGRCVVAPCAEDAGGGTK